MSVHPIQSTALRRRAWLTHEVLVSVSTSVKKRKKKVKNTRATSHLNISMATELQSNFMYFFTKWKHRYIHLKEKHLIQWFPNTGVRTYSGTSAPSSGMRGILSCTTRGVQFSFFFCFSSYFLFTLHLKRFFIGL